MKSLLWHLVCYQVGQEATRRGRQARGSMHDPHVAGLARGQGLLQWASL